MLHSFLRFVLFLVIFLTTRLVSAGITKPTANVGTLGHPGHGKTTLTAAITKFLANYGGKVYTVDEIQNGWQYEQKRHQYAHITTVEYYTSLRHYTHVDCPSYPDYTKGMISGEIKLDGAILVVSATDGIMPQTVEHVALSKDTGISSMVVFINKCDLMDDAELLELIEIEVRELLLKYGFPGDDVPIIRGSALKALDTYSNWRDGIRQLVEMMDKFIPETKPAISKPFLMPIEKVVNIPNKGVAANGYIETGVIKKGMRIEIVGIRSTLESTCTEVQMGGASIDYASPGDNVNILLSSATVGSIERGQVLATPGSIQSHRKFKSGIYFFTEDENENEDEDESIYEYTYTKITSKFQNYQISFYFRDIEIIGAMEEFQYKRLGYSAEYLEVIVQLDNSVAINKEDHFTVRDNGRTVAIGLVINFIE